MKTASKSNWLTALSKVIDDSLGKIEPGYQSVEEIAAEIRLSVRRTREVVAALVKSGGAVKKKFRVRVGNVTVNKFYFKLKP